MSLDAVKILEINVTKTAKSDILKEIQKYFGSGRFGSPETLKNIQKTVKPFIIVTPNPEQVVYAQNDSHFREILNRADVSLPDGVGVVWASRVLEAPRITYHVSRITEAIPGVDFMENLVSMAAKQRVPIALIGGRGGLALKTLECLQKKHPGLSGWAIDGPEVRITNYELRMTNENTETYFQTLAKRITDSGARMVFVGLGAPKQEYFIELLLMSLRSGSAGEAISPIKKDCRVVPRGGTPRNDNRIILMSVGGSFDEIAGRLPRAPEWMGKLGIKWLWRLILQPWRIRRQLALIRFAWLVLKERYTLK